MTLWEKVRSFITPDKFPVGGLLGESLEGVNKTDLFTWFHLTETSRVRAGRGRSVVKFKPSGSKFHDLVTVEVSLNQSGRVVGISLLLERSFVEDDRDGVFARDIAKSLLRTVGGDKPPEELKSLADEIEFAHDYPLIVGPGYRPPPPKPAPSPGFLTYLGRRGTYTQSFPGFALALENITDGVRPCLSISLRSA
jgi:hypothetical protein